MTGEDFNSLGAPDLNRLIAWSLTHRALALEAQLGRIGIGSSANLELLLHLPVHIEEGMPELFPIVTQHYRAIYERAHAAWYRSADVNASEPELAALYQWMFQKIFRTDTQILGPDGARYFNIIRPATLRFRDPQGDVQVSDIWPDGAIRCEYDDSEVMMLLEFKAKETPSCGDIAQVYSELLSYAHTHGASQVFGALLYQEGARFMDLTLVAGTTHHAQGIPEQRADVKVPIGRLRISPAIDLSSPSDRWKFPVALLAANLEYMRRELPQAIVPEKPRAWPSRRRTRPCAPLRELLQASLRPLDRNAGSVQSHCDLDTVIVAKLWIQGSADSSVSGSSGEKQGKRDARDAKELRLDPTLAPPRASAPESYFAPSTRLTSRRGRDQEGPSTERRLRFADDPDEQQELAIPQYSSKVALSSAQSTSSARPGSRPGDQIAKTSSSRLGAAFRRTASSPTNSPRRDIAPPLSSRYVPASERLVTDRYKENVPATDPTRASSLASDPGESYGPGVYSASVYTPHHHFQSTSASRLLHASMQDPPAGRRTRTPSPQKRGQSPLLQAPAADKGKRRAPSPSKIGGSSPESAIFELSSNR